MSREEAEKIIKMRKSTSPIVIIDHISLIGSQKITDDGVQQLQKIGRMMRKIRYGVERRKDKINKLLNEIDSIKK